MNSDSLSSYEIVLVKLMSLAIAVDGVCEEKELIAAAAFVEHDKNVSINDVILELISEQVEKILESGYAVNSIYKIIVQDVLEELSNISSEVQRERLAIVLNDFWTESEDDVLNALREKVIIALGDSYVFEIESPEKSGSINRKKHDLTRSLEKIDKYLNSGESLDEETKKQVEIVKNSSKSHTFFNFVFVVIFAFWVYASFSLDEWIAIAISIFIALGLMGFLMNWNDKRVLRSWLSEQRNK